MSARKEIENVIEDLVAKLLYYDRKEDYDFPVGRIEDDIKNEEYSLEDMVCMFRDELVEAMEQS